MTIFIMVHLKADFSKAVLCQVISLLYFNFWSKIISQFELAQEVCLAQSPPGVELLILSLFWRKSSWPHVTMTWKKKNQHCILRVSKLVTHPDLCIARALWSLLPISVLGYIYNLPKDKSWGHVKSFQIPFRTLPE